MNRGTRPTPKDPRDTRFHFYRFFGSTVSPYREIDNDAYITNPDQNFENRANSCTAYTVTDIATDQSKNLYSHDFQMMKTLLVMGVTDPSKGADARTAAKIPVSVGVLSRAKQPESMIVQNEAWAANSANWPNSLDTQTERKPAYIPISPERGQSWFDAIYNALDKGFTIGLATQWSPDFEVADYILPETPQNLYWGHMYKVTGCTLLEGNPYLKVKSWQARKYKNGICLMSPALIQKLMSQWGTYAVTFAHLSSDVIDAQKQQQVTILEVLIALYQNLIHQLWHGFKGLLNG